ncbi:type I-U CRISPR-associated protein Csx17 [Nocardia sp. NPDC127606]|uniref:type I-G CRISPR-associated protein Cas8g1/Csx17 n=1 Tax=Nocardia sp. NPDC127606 TaxID=3345406 RepID=UPI003624B454
MPVIDLPGCRNTSLGGYLSALGVLRTVTRQFDAEATGHWQGDEFALTSRFSNVAELIRELAAEFQPLPIVSPWNAGSGFAGNGKSATAEGLIAWVENSSDPRLVQLQAAVRACRLIVTEGARHGLLGDSTLWSKDAKDDVLRLSRNLLPDDALEWLDTAVALTDGDPVYSRLVGTGGNFGRLELSATYIRFSKLVLENRNSVDWLDAALTGRADVQLPKESLGQYDPSGVGAPEESNSIGNPWTFLLLIGGTTSFSTAVVRRHGSAYARAALPFQVRSTAAGFNSAALGEKALAEQWTPEWSEPMTATEIDHLLTEGRADWRNQPAHTALDMIRSCGTLGTARGITAFGRHIFVERLGRSPLAVYGGRIKIDEHPGIRTLEPLDRWIETVTRTKPPRAIETTLSTLKEAIYQHAGSGKPSDLVAVFASIGQLRRALDRSTTSREALAGLRFPDPHRVLTGLMPARQEDIHLRIALSIVTGHDRKGDVNAVRLADLNAGLYAALLSAVKRRAQPRPVAEPTDHSVPKSAVKGARIAYRKGLDIDVGDIVAVARGEIESERIANLLAGLDAVRWPEAPNAAWTQVDDRHTDRQVNSDPAIDLLLQFTTTEQVMIGKKDGSRRLATLCPGFEWPSLLAAGRTSEVLEDAAQRLRLAGLRFVATPSTALNSDHLAAILLLRSKRRDRFQALTRIAVPLEDRPTAVELESHSDEEITA